VVHQFEGEEETRVLFCCVHSDNHATCKAQYDKTTNQVLQSFLCSLYRVGKAQNTGVTSSYTFQWPMLFFCLGLQNRTWYHILVYGISRECMLGILHCELPLHKRQDGSCSVKPCHASELVSMCGPKQRTK
jgi:hypothetical protein